MFCFLIGLCAGMFIAWFFVNPPAFAKELKDKLIAKFPALAHFAKKDGA